MLGKNQEQEELTLLSNLGSLAPHIESKPVSYGLQTHNIKLIKQAN